jgi:mRNA interferase MazF
MECYKNEEIKQYDVCICDFPKYVEVADSGVRPCIVISNDTNNLFSDRVNVVPLTTKIKKPLITHCFISSCCKVTSTALCENIITIDKNRLINKIGSLNDFEKKNVEYCIRRQLNIL